MLGLINRYRNNRRWEKEAKVKFNGMSKSERTKFRPISETPTEGVGGVWGFCDYGNLKDCGSLVYKRGDKFYLLSQPANLPRIEVDIVKWRYSNF